MMSDEGLRSKLGDVLSNDGGGVVKCGRWHGLIQSEREPPMSDADVGDEEREKSGV